jgi:hypothetical protein
LLSFRAVRALRVLLATLIAVPLLAWSASEGAIAWVLRDVDRPARPTLAPSFAHRGLACIEGQSAYLISRPYVIRAGGKQLDHHLRNFAMGMWLKCRFDNDELIRLQGDSVWLGRGAFGLEAGAQAWFGKPLSELTPAQSALLVGFVQAPAIYDPTKHAERAARRRQYVLGKWQTCGLVPAGTEISIHGRSAMDGVIAPPPRAVRPDDEDD